MASIQDVAKYAGVGVGTASRVINNKGSVSASTREKVIKAIEALDYTPSEVARSLKKQSTTLVGLLVHDVSHQFYAELTKCIEAALYKRDYKLLLCNSEFSKDKEMNYLQMLKMNQVAGIITISYNDYSAMENMALPVVTIDRYINDKIPHVTSDNYFGGCLATEALIRGGATYLGYMGGEPIYHSSVSDRKRALIDTAIERDVPYVVYETTYAHNQERMTSEEFVKMYPEVNGIFTSSDTFAAALYQEYQKVGKKIPEDVQIIGFDGIQKEDFFKPYLSTIVQSMEGIGEKSVELLDALINNQTVASENIIPVSFRQGETSFRHKS